VERSAELPRQIGRYEIEAEIGRGMMGVVYRAQDPLLRRTVALKVIELAFPVSPQERERFEQRFVAEGRIVAKLSHPGIVMVHDVGRDEKLGRPYLALEYLVGRTLEERLAEGRPPGWEAPVRTAVMVARALRCAHDAGVVHRDVKPANIMILENGEARVMDFGVARLETGLGLTHTGHMVGTPLFMSPEQALGESVDGRADLFSLASVLYTLLTGEHAFAAESVPLILTKVAYDDPPPPSERVASLPESLDRVLARALQKSRDARYPDGDQLADDLEDVLAGHEPRHLVGWSPPARGGTGTLVAAAPGSGRGVAAAPRSGTAIAPPPEDARPVGTGSPEPLPRSGGRRRSRWPMWLLAAALIGGLAATRDTWRPRLERFLESEEGQRLRARTGELLDSAAREAGERGREVLESAVSGIADSAAPGPAEPTPVPDPGTLLSAVRAPDPDPGAEPGRLSVSLTHPAGGGRLRLWMDEDLIFEGSLLATPAQPSLVFQSGRGRLRGVLPLAPGARRLRVALERDGVEAQAEELAADLEPGQSRHLEIAIGGDGGLSLGWR
jgi:hypothetical protein